MSDLKTSVLKRPATFIGAALLSTLLAGTAAFAASSTPASIIAMSQKPKNNSVTITYAFLPKAGSLDLYAAGRSGKREGKPLASVALKAGDHRDVEMKLTPVPDKGARLVAVIEQSGQPIKHSGDRPERTFSVL
ncbi:MAG: hypothetical protein JSR99_14510 [Proteobacteria bacterium]|nr:hypothetical protein [Pseudomonadota bacterium]